MCSRQTKNSTLASTHEADRRVRARQIVTFRQFVDELAESAKVDQEFHADDVDQAEGQARGASPVKIAGIAAGNRIFRNICHCVSRSERPTSISTARVADRPSTVFRITGADAGGESEDHDGDGRSAEQHQEQRIGQHQRRRRPRRDPRLEGASQRSRLIQPEAERHADREDQQTCRERLDAGEQKASRHMFLDDDAAECGEHVRMAAARRNG